MHKLPNKKVYIGITSLNPERRWRKGEGYKNNKHFYSAILKYGWNNIEHIVMFEDLTKQEACEKEKELILKMKSHDRAFGYNFTFGGESYEFTPEIKEKLKVNHSHAWNGRHHSEETKAKISKANKGRMFSEEHKEKIKKNHSHCKTFEGRHHSIESRRKISENHFRLYGADNPSAKKVKCVETGIIFETIKEAADQTHANKNHISSCCNGHRKTCGGYHWEFVVML
jgi:group I intron endonuclease